jgi:GNAT superfamily N-acetyltransferase
MPLFLRPAAPDDRAAIQMLMVSVIKTSVDEPHHSETIENVTKNLERWHRDPETCLHIVAQRGNEIIGVILVKEFWNLCSLFVSQECQRQGIGRELVLAAIEGCRARSPKQAINLNSSPRAVAFYKSLGFVHRESSQSLPPGFKPMKLALAVSEA